MSFIESLIPLLPSSTRAVSQIASGVAGRNVAQASARRLEQIGRQEAQLRRIQAARLLGQVQASFGARGVAGGDVTSSDIEREAAYLEAVDVARAEFRFTSLADQVRRAGQGEFARGIVGGVSGFFDLMRAAKRESQIGELTDVAKEIKAGLRARTVLQPLPRVGLPGSAVNTLPRPRGFQPLEPGGIA